MNKLILPGQFALAAPHIDRMGAIAFANTLTRLIPDLFAAVDVVSRELVGMIPSATRNTAAERAAVGESVVYPITPELGTFNVTPAMAIPEPTDRVIDNDTIVITNSEGVEFGWTGEEQKGLNNGPGYLTIQGDLFAQGLRTLTNKIEAAGYLAAVNAAVVATGTAGTTPFASNVGDSAQVRKLLDDRGAPMSDRSLVIDTTAGAALRTLGNLTKANEAGTTMTLRDGELLNLNGLSIKESAGAPAARKLTAGTAASATTNTTGYAVGAKVITLASAGTGTILAGDFVSFAGDSTKYRIATTGGDADVSNGGTITLDGRGLMQPIPAVATNVTVSRATGGYAVNVAFPRHAVHLVARTPAMPAGGDAASESMMITDVRSGMTYEIRIYKGYHKIRAEVAAAWGWKVTKKDHVVALLG